jgi:hypothetical protein
MSDDSYWTQGAILDRAKAYDVQVRIAKALERIADSLEADLDDTGLDTGD